MGSKRGQGRMGVAPRQSQVGTQPIATAPAGVQEAFNGMLGKIFGELDEFAKQELEGRHGYSIFGLKNAIQSHVNTAYGMVVQEGKTSAPAHPAAEEEKASDGQA